jgi:hypothetical protein
VDKENVVHMHNGILFNHKKGDNMSGTGSTVLDKMIKKQKTNTTDLIPMSNLKKLISYK